MRAAAGVLISSVILLSGGAALGEPSPTITQLLDICAASTIAEAEARVGGVLPWEPMPDQEVEDWRSGFKAHHQRDVTVSAWRQGAQEGADRLAFWISSGPGGHTGCAYTSSHAGNLLDELSARFGAPAYLKRHELAATAMWTTTGREITFSQLDATAIIYIARKN